MLKKQLKNKILFELKKDSIPDLKFLYSKEVLNIALELLEELLEEEKKDFKKKLKIKDFDITFETFEEFSLLDYFYSLLDHLQNIKSSKKIREIIEKIEPKLIDFSNEIAYNKRYYEMIKYCRRNCKLSKEQKRILDEDIKAYKVR
jgi:Zn-dependent oligopeptidase